MAMGSGIVPSDELRRMEIAANDAFDQYREQYYEGGVSSCYFWDNEGKAERVSSWGRRLCTLFCWPVLVQIVVSAPVPQRHLPLWYQRRWLQADLHVALPSRRSLPQKPRRSQK